MLEKSNLMNEINEILEKTGGPCVLIEDGQIKSVVLSFNQYKKLVDNHQSQDNQENIRTKDSQEENHRQPQNNFIQKEEAPVEEITPLAEDEIIKEMKEKLDQWKEQQDEAESSNRDFLQDQENVNSGEKERNNETNNNQDNLDKTELKNNEISLDDLPLE